MSIGIIRYNTTNIFTCLFRRDNEQVQAKSGFKIVKKFTYH